MNAESTPESSPPPLPPKTSLTAESLDYHFPTNKRNLWVVFVGLPGCGKSQTIADLIPTLSDEYKCLDQIYDLFKAEEINAFYENPQQNAFSLQMKGLQNYEQVLCSIESEDLYPRPKKFQTADFKHKLVIEHTSLELIETFTSALFELGYLSRANLVEIEREQRKLYEKRQKVMELFRVLTFEMPCPHSVATKNVRLRKNDDRFNYRWELFSQVMSIAEKHYLRNWSKRKGANILLYKPGVLPSDGVLRKIKNMPIAGSTSAARISETTPGKRKRGRPRKTADPIPPPKTTRQAASTSASAAMASGSQNTIHIPTPQIPHRPRIAVPEVLSKPPSTDEEKVMTFTEIKKTFGFDCVKDYGKYIPFKTSRPIMVFGESAPRLISSNVVFLSHADILDFNGRVSEKSNTVISE